VPVKSRSVMVGQGGGTRSVARTRQPTLVPYQGLVPLAPPFQGINNLKYVQHPAHNLGGRAGHTDEHTHNQFWKKLGHVYSTVGTVGAVGQW